MNDNWYDNLIKSPYTPPNTIFSFLWTILYITIFISFTIIIYTTGFSFNKAIIFFSIQMILNFLWAPVFFKLRKIWLSLIIVILMWIFILLTIVEFFKINKMAGLILLPYLLWVSLATYLNAYIYVFNK